MRTDCGETVAGGGGAAQNAGRRRLVRAAMVVDAAGVHAAPGVLLLEERGMVAAGTPPSVGTPAGVEILERPDHVLVPALVNAHCHLDLTHVGCVPFGGSFVEWIEMVRQRRASGEAEIADSVQRGIALARAGGTAVVGDIAGAASLVPGRVLRAQGMGGVSYLEVFGLGRAEAGAIARLERAVRRAPGREGGVALGVQPHAPYSCGPAVYRAAAALGRPLSTHLAETLEEIRFTDASDGPLADLLRRLGAWDETIRGWGRHPVDLFAAAGPRPPCVAAHVNYLEPRHMEPLRRHGISVAYCPRASAYFGHPRNGERPHAYRRMLERGINVALGTDSVICLDRGDRLSILDEMRHLFLRDGTDPRTLLEMATINGARALGFDPAPFTLAPGPAGSAGIIALPGGGVRGADPLAAAVRAAGPPEWILTPGRGGGGA